MLLYSHPSALRWAAASEISTTAAGKSRLLMRWCASSLSTPILPL